MTPNNCCFRWSCSTIAVIAGVILGVLAAFLQITAVITVTPAFLWVALGIAVVYLAILLASAAFTKSCNVCRCGVLNVLLAGILGTILFAVILLAVGIVATSVVSAILVGLLVLFLTLTLAASACFVRCLSNCEAQT